MDHYKATAATWNKLANVYEAKFMDLTMYNESYDFVCNTLSKNQTTVLEVGCGPGMITRYLLSKRPDFNILGTDVAPNMVSLAQKNNPKAEFRMLDCREISSLNQHFDAILSGFCIPYLSPNDVATFISDSSQILRSNGLLYLSFVDGEETSSGMQTGSTGDSIYFYFHPKENIHSLLVENGFQIARHFEIPYSLADGSTQIHNVLCVIKA